LDNFESKYIKLVTACPTSLLAGMTLASNHTSIFSEINMEDKR
jgi:hypothetical protein